MLKGRILITGGTGSLGTAILERAQRENWPAEFTVLARNETKISLTQQRFPYVRCEIGDVRNYSRLLEVFPGHDLVIHAAAIKIVPVAEASPSEAVRTNVIGSMNVARAAIDSDVRRVIGISTDKACQPVNTYGHTKSLMEFVFKEAEARSSTEFILCRYGNVIGSANSILPLLIRQKAEGVPFTVTDARCTRFWLTMTDAINIVLRAVDFRENGVILVPKAPASKVISLFHAVDNEWPIIDIGIRPGEKIHEQLVGNSESRHTVDRGEYFIIYPASSEVISNLPDGYGYCSDTTDRQLSPEDLLKMLNT